MCGWRGQAWLMYSSQLDLGSYLRVKASLQADYLALLTTTHFYLYLKVRCTQYINVMRVCLLGVIV